MKNLVLEPKEENIIDTFLKDSIGRDEDIITFVKMIDSLEESTSIAIDSDWGDGKTFFVKQTKLILDCYNKNINNNNAKKEEIKAKTNKIVQALLHTNQDFYIQDHVSIYYDAWVNDNDEDPILSLCYSILKDMNLDYDLSSNATDIFELLSSIAELCGVSKIGSIITILKNLSKQNNPLQSISDQKELEDEVKNFLGTILPERGHKLVIFIDELDRCKPTYAVKLLERIKHYFSNEQIVFVFSVNINQLQHTVKAFYGDDFDASRYLDRFFDFRLSLPKINDIDNFIGYISSENKTKYQYKLLNKICKIIGGRNLSLREFAKFYRHMSMATNLFFKNKKDWSTFNTNAGDFCITYIVPLLILLKITNQDEYLNFIEGRSKDINGNIVIFNKIFDSIDDENIEKYWIFPENTIIDTKRLNILADLKKLYYELFENKSEIEFKKIGTMSIEKELREKVLRIANMFSEESEFMNDDLESTSQLSELENN